VISLSSYVLVNYINVDAFIARENMKIYYQTGTVDVAYLSEMSYDTTSCLKELSKSSNVLLSTAAQKAITSRKEVLAGEEKWQSFNLSKYRANDLLNN